MLGLGLPGGRRASAVRVRVYMWFFSFLFSGEGVCLLGRKGWGFTAGEEEDGIGELDGGEVAKVAHVDGVAEEGEEGEPEGEVVDEGEEDLRRGDGVDEAGEEFAREDAVLFDQFGEVVESRCFWVEGGDGQRRGIGG